MKTTILLVLMAICLNLNAQKFEDLKCIGLTSGQVFNKMVELKIARTDLGGKTDSIMMSYRDLNYGLIILYFNKKYVCNRQLFQANYSLKNLINYNLEGCKKSVCYKPDFFIIEYQ